MQSSKKIKRGQLDGFGDWTDYSATSTIIGWSSFTQKNIWYKIKDGYMFVDFYLEGTSNSTSATLTLPNNSAEGFSVFRPSGYNVNNSIVLTNSARIGIPNGTNLVTITRDFTGLTWTGSGVKGIAGQISFKI